MANFLAMKCGESVAALRVAALGDEALRPVLAAKSRSTRLFELAVSTRSSHSRRSKAAARYCPNERKLMGCPVRWRSHAHGESP
jgi:hypothetical protein